MMKRKGLIVLIILLVALFAVSVIPTGAKKACTPISSGVLYFNGNLVKPGVNDNGYNYQAHEARFTTHNTTWWYVTHLKWNDAYLSNEDCDGDYKLDRHYGFDSYIGSGAWITFHYNGEYEKDGMTCAWDELIKAVAVPEGAYKVNGIYYTADGSEIGPVSSEVASNGFATVQHVLNDPCHGLEGNQLNSPDRAGLGGW
jgi:hypothetical protein